MYKVLFCVLGVNPVRLESMRRLPKHQGYVRIVLHKYFQQIAQLSDNKQEIQALSKKNLAENNS